MSKDFVFKIGDLVNGNGAQGTNWLIWDEPKKITKIYELEYYHHEVGHHQHIYVDGEPTAISGMLLDLVGREYVKPEEPIITKWELNATYEVLKNIESSEDPDRKIGDEFIIIKIMPLAFDGKITQAVGLFSDKSISILGDHLLENRSVKYIQSEEKSGKIPKIVINLTGFFHEIVWAKTDDAHMFEVFNLIGAFTGEYRIIDKRYPKEAEQASLGGILGAALRSADIKKLEHKYIDEFLHIGYANIRFNYQH